MFALSAVSSHLTQHSVIMSAPKKILHQLRKEYTKHGLSKREMAPGPLIQFDRWFREALETGVAEPNAMTLSTAGKAGRPSARIVLLKDFDERGFVFYTNYNSGKGRQIAENPFAALSFFWQELERQIRIEGSVEKIPAAESDEYFNSRPRGSRLAAIVSPQSQVIESRDLLEKNWNELHGAPGSGNSIPRPEHWGGFRVKPDRVEFWQGRDNRMHDRIVYILQESNTWSIRRLAP